ncbi:MAG: transposase, partial [Gammaproteobacteria bacterium]
MVNKHRAEHARQQRHVRKQVQKVARQVDSMSFFNLLTGPELLGQLEALLPEYRERKYPPTVALAMFLGQVLSADGSCQNAVNEAMVNQLLRGMEPGAANTGSYSDARKRLPRELVQELARSIATLMGTRTPARWTWRGRHIKLVDGTTILMPDTSGNQELYPQHGSQAAGAGFPIARLVGVISLAHGAVLDVAMGPYQGKGTGEHALLRELLK